MSSPSVAEALVSRPASPKQDPFWAKILAAPLDDEPESDEERAAFEAVQADIASARHGHSADEIAALVEQMRIDQGE